MPFQTLFEPVVKPRENIRLVPKIKKEQVFYRVEYVEPIFGYLLNLGEVSPGSTTTTYEVTELDLDPLELGQWRILILDDFELIVKQPRASERGTTKDKSTRITPYTLALDPELKATEFFTFEDETRIYLQAENKTNDSVVARVFFFGWKFLLTELKEAPAKYTDIPIGVVTRARG